MFRNDDSTIPFGGAGPTGLGYDLYTDMPVSAIAICAYAHIYHDLLYKKNYTLEQLVPPILKTSDGSARRRLTLPENIGGHQHAAEELPERAASSRLLQSAVGANKPFPEIFQDILASYKTMDYVGIHGEVNFNEAGDVAVPTYVEQVTTPFLIHNVKNWIIGPYPEGDVFSPTSGSGKLSQVKIETFAGTKTTVTKFTKIPVPSFLQTNGKIATGQDASGYFYLAFTYTAVVPKSDIFALSNTAKLQKLPDSVEVSHAAAGDATVLANLKIHTLSAKHEAALGADIYNLPASGAGGAKALRFWREMTVLKFLSASKTNGTVSVTHTAALGTVQRPTVSVYTPSTGKFTLSDYPKNTFVFPKADYIFGAEEDQQDINGAKNIQLKIDEASRLPSFISTCRADSRVFSFAAQQCESCPDTYTFDREDGVCKCSAGYEPSADGVSCTGCPISYFKGSAGNFACVACPTGSVTHKEGATRCGPCQVGQFYSEKECGATIDKRDCPPECAKCPAGMTTVSPVAGVGGVLELDGVQNCVCPDGSYLSPASATCVVCPEGIECKTDPATGLSNIAVKREYFMPDFIEPALEVYACRWNSATLLRIYNEAAPEKRTEMKTPCPGYHVGSINVKKLPGAVTEITPSDVETKYNTKFQTVLSTGDSNSLCVDGREGNACGRCISGFNENTEFVCEKCEGADGWPVPTFLIIGFVLIVPANYWILCCPPQPRPDSIGEAAQLMSSFFLMIQLFALVGLLGVTWSEDALQLFATTAITTGETRGLRPQCIFGSSPTTTFVTKPIVITLALIWSQQIPFIAKLLEGGPLKKLVEGMPRNGDARMNVIMRKDLIFI